MNRTERVTLRDARKEEWSVMEAVTLAAYAQYRAVMPEHHWKRYKDHLIQTVHEEGPQEHIVAEYEGAIVGSVLLYPPLASAYADFNVDNDVPEVRLLAVVPTMRRQGIADVLMEECEQRAMSTGGKVLELHTMEMMREARRLYERRGFIHVPAFDFSPTPHVVVMGYRLQLTCGKRA